MTHHTILECVVGSTLHGTSVEDGLEDLDLMAIVLERPEQMIGFSVTDTWVTRTKPQGVRSEAGDTDHVAYGLRKFLSLALKGNPTILLPLFAPASAVRITTPQGEQLRAMAPLIISKQCYAPFRGYMHQQHQRLVGTLGQKNVTRPELIEKYGYDTKYAGHIVRLGLQGAELLHTGRLTLPMREEQRQLVVAVRTGQFTLERVSHMIESMEQILSIRHDQSTLRDKPDHAQVEAWMLDTYLQHWETL